MKADNEAKRAERRELLQERRAERRELLQERREERREVLQERRENFQENLQAKRENFQENIQGLQDNLHENIQDLQENLQENLQEIHTELVSSRKSNDTEDRFDRIFTDPCGLFWARIFIKLGWTPNAVTILSMVVGMAGGALFISRNIWLLLLGIVLEIYADILDSTDGQIARLTNQRSRLGRILDGISDGFCFLAMYAGLAVRLMSETLPFSQRQWGWLAPAVYLVFAATGHLRQSKAADLYRNAHLFFLSDGQGGELSRVKDTRAELASLPKKTALPYRLFLAVYSSFTAGQQKLAPELMKLLACLEEQGLPAGLCEDYVAVSRRYIQLTNVLTYNVRVYPLFILLLLGLESWYILFAVLILGGLNLFMISRYEKLARELRLRYFPVRTDNAHET